MSANDVEVPHHDGEEIVEIMCNAAGQLADSLHLLRLAQLLLGLLAGRDINDAADDAHESAALGAFDASRDQGVHHLPRLGNEPALEVTQLSHAQHLDPAPFCDMERIHRYKPRHALSDHLVATIAKQVEPCVADLD